MEAKGCKNDLITLNTLMRGLCKAIKMQSSHRLLTRMGIMDLAPNVGTYNIFLEGLYKDGNMEMVV